MNWLLKPAELAYRGVNRIRRAVYRAGILKAKRLPVPVISVGGIAAGGSGKTPAVIAIARELCHRGLRVGVLTRGYRRRGSGGLVTALDAKQYGDEPVLIKKRVPEADVIVGANRYENAKQQQVDVFVLDDGFQHLQLHRDLDVVIDDPRAWFLREGRSALRHADVILHRRMRLSMPPMLRGTTVFAFAGLADNQQFFRSLRDAGFKLAGTREFSDHHWYSPNELHELKKAAGAAGAGAVVTTEKDAVKIDDASIIAVPAEFMIDPADLEHIVAAVRR